MRYWLYKWNTKYTRPGWRTDWATVVFDNAGETPVGGHQATRSRFVERLLDDEVRPGDVVVSYQTNRQAVIGFCRLERTTGRPGDLTLYVKPIHRLDPPFRIHERKHGTLLETAAAVRSQYMLSELEKAEMEDLVRLSGAPKRVLKGTSPPGGYRT